MTRSKDTREFEVTLRFSADTWLGVVHAMHFFAEHFREHIRDKTCSAKGDCEGTAWTVKVVRGTKER